MSDRAASAERGAGAFAQARFRARKRAWLKRIWWIFPVVAALEIGVAVGLGALLQPRHLAFYWGLGIGIAVTMVMVFADSPPHHVERWRQGFEGEVATAKTLRRLVADGWLVLNDIDIRYGNLDHVVVGPPGIFLLETKSLNGLLTIDHGVLSVRWREDPSDGYENRRLTPRMEALARSVSRRLERDGISDAPIQPVVVLWGNFEQRSMRSKGHVAWVHGKELVGMLRRRPTALSPDEMARIGAVLRQPWTAG
jgi:hypothetical protein